MGYSSGWNAKSSVAPSSRWRFTWLFILSAPVFHVPAGMTTVPPPLAEHVDMALFMAFWLAAAVALTLAPNCLMLKLLFGNSGILMLLSICLYSLSFHPCAITHTGIESNRSSVEIICFIIKYLISS